MVNEKKVSEALASAMISLAHDDHQVPLLYQDVSWIKQFNDNDHCLIDFLVNPWIEKSQKIKDIMQLKSCFNYDKTVNWLAIMVQGNVAYFFDKSLNFLLRALEEELGIVSLKIYSAFPLTQAQVTKITTAIKNNPQLLPSNFKELRSQCVVDSNLIGGIKVEINSKVIDNTIFEKLRQLQSFAR